MRYDRSLGRTPAAISPTAWSIRLLGHPVIYGAIVLVLTRDVGQSIMIGTKIKVTVVGVRNDQVRLGIAAPSEVTVHREEVFEELREQNRSAARAQPRDLEYLPRNRRRAPSD